MPVAYLRGLTGRTRQPGADRQLAGYLAFVAGAVNAGGFLAVQQYTSHMTGIVSGMADNLALGRYAVVAGGLAAVLAFLAGAACSAMMIHWGRRRSLHSEYALPLMAEAGLLLAFGIAGSRLHATQWLFVSATAALLCFVMGLQNAMITKLSRAEIRTTHVTGLITDLGIELGKSAYWNRRDAVPPVRADRTRLRLLARLVGLFFVGGVLGALGFARLGFVATVPLAALLCLLALVPVLDDLRARF